MGLADIQAMPHPPAPDTALLSPRPDVAASTLPLAVVLNAAAGHLETEERVHTITQVLGEADREHLVLPVEPARGMDAVVEQALAWAQRRGGAVVAAGGDGTLNTVAQAAYNAGCPMGALPQGTFNYFARSHGIPTDLSEAVRCLLQARPQPVQVGRLNERVFLVNASLGLYPQILSDREAFKAQWGRYRINAVLSALLTILREHRSWHLSLDLGDRQVEVDTTTLLVSNSTFQLGALGLPEAQVASHGALGALLVHPVSRGRLLWLALQGALGRLAQAEGAVDFAFRRLTVLPGRRRRALKVSVDGEVLQMPLPLTFEVAPRPLMLLKPHEGEPA